VFKLQQHGTHFFNSTDMIVSHLSSNYIGMLSKSVGQILRVSVVMHVLFNMDGNNLPTVVSEAAVNAAIDFVEVCCQHTAFITGRGKICDDLTLIEAGMIKCRVMHGHRKIDLTLHDYFEHTSTCTCQVPPPVLQSLLRRVLKH